MISNVVFFESELKSNSEPKCLEIFTNKSLYLLTGQKLIFVFIFFVGNSLKQFHFIIHATKPTTVKKKKQKKVKKATSNKKEECEESATKKMLTNTWQSFLYFEWAIKKHQLRRELKLWRGEISKKKRKTHLKAINDHSKNWCVYSTTLLSSLTLLKLQLFSSNTQLCHD
jgi:hypothetical protein